MTTQKKTTSHFLLNPQQKSIQNKTLLKSDCLKSDCYLFLRKALQFLSSRRWRLEFFRYENQEYPLRIALSKNRELRAGKVSIPTTHCYGCFIPQEDGSDNPRSQVGVIILDGSVEKTRRPGRETTCKAGVGKCVDGGWIKQPYLTEATGLWSRVKPGVYSSVKCCTRTQRALSVAQRPSRRPSPYSPVASDIF